MGHPGSVFELSCRLEQALQDTDEIGRFGRRSVGTLRSRQQIGGAVAATSRRWWRRWSAALATPRWRSMWTVGGDSGLHRIEKTRAFGRADRAVAIAVDKAEQFFQRVGANALGGVVIRQFVEAHRAIALRVACSEHVVVGRTAKLLRKESEAGMMVGMPCFDLVVERRLLIGGDTAAAVGVDRLEQCLGTLVAGRAGASWRPRFQFFERDRVILVGIERLKAWGLERAPAPRAGNRPT